MVEGHGCTPAKFYDITMATQPIFGQYRPTGLGSTDQVDGLFVRHLRSPKLRSKVKKYDQLWVVSNLEQKNCVLGERPQMHSL